MPIEYLVLAAVAAGLIALAVVVVPRTRSYVLVVAGLTVLALATRFGLERIGAGARSVVDSQRNLRQARKARKIAVKQQNRRLEEEEIALVKRQKEIDEVAAPVADEVSDADVAAAIKELGW